MDIKKNRQVIRTIRVRRKTNSLIGGPDSFKTFYIFLCCIIVYFILKCLAERTAAKATLLRNQDKKNQFMGYHTQKSPKLKAAKTVCTGQNRSMERSNQKLESFREFYKVYRPEEPPKTINVE